MIRVAPRPALGTAHLTRLPVASAVVATRCAQRSPRTTSASTGNWGAYVPIILSETDSKRRRRRVLDTCKALTYGALAESTE